MANDNSGRSAAVTAVDAAVKRLFDIVGSVLGLLVSAPACLLIY